MVFKLEDKVRILPNIMVNSVLYDGISILSDMVFEGYREIVWKSPNNSTLYRVKGMPYTYTGAMFENINGFDIRINPKFKINLNYSL